MGSTSYRELGLLAEGGMATVARAVRVSDGRPVVIKRVRPPLCFDQTFVRLFADEAAVHAALDDDHVVRLLDRGDDAQGPFLVFEHVDGTDLGALLDTAIAAGRPLDVEFVLAVAVPLLSALAFVHEACRDGVCLDVVHRDVSPGNVLLGEDGAVKLADFGVAASRLKTEHTVAGEVKGKFAYMAPEQTRGETTTPRTDLFAVGVVLWECLANRRLWDGATDADIVRAVRDDAAPPLDVGRVGADVADVVAALLHKDPAQRPASARVVRERLLAACVDRGLDDGLGRIVARAVRLAPRRERSPLPEVRRRTQRVVGDAPSAVRRRPLRTLFVGGVALAVVALVGVVGAAASGLFAQRAPVELVTTLPPTPGLPTPALPPTPAGAPTVAAPTAIAPPPPPTTTPARRPTRPPAPNTAKTPNAAASTTTAEGFGRLSVTSEPWARVAVDGVVVAHETPLVGFTLAAGRHTLRLENPVVGLTKTVVVDVHADGHERVFVDLAR